MWRDDVEDMLGGAEVQTSHHRRYLGQLLVGENVEGRREGLMCDEVCARVAGVRLSYPGLDGLAVNLECEDGAVGKNIFPGEVGVVSIGTLRCDQIRVNSESAFKDVEINTGDDDLFAGEFTEVVIVFDGDGYLGKR